MIRSISWSSTPATGPVRSLADRAEPEDGDASAGLGYAVASGLPVACEAWESCCGGVVCRLVDEAPEQDPRARTVNKAIAMAET